MAGFYRSLTKIGPRDALLALKEKAITQRLMIPVAFDPRRGYITLDADAPRLSALSLSGLRRQLEAAHAGKDVEIILTLDKRARSERDARRRGVTGGRNLRGAENS